MLAPFRFADGTNLLPGASWVNENTTGFYRFDGGDLRIAVLTADIMRWNASGAQLYNSVTLAWDAVAVVGGSGTVPDGTADGDTLVWDQTTDQAWEIQVANPAGRLPVGTDGQTLRYELSTNTWDVTSAIVVSDASISTISSLVATTADIEAGTVDALIGGTTPAVGTFTTLNATTYTGLPTSSETVVGIIELATQAEVNTGTDTGRAVTPATLASWTGDSGIALTDLSASVAAVGTANLSYDNTTGVFTYTPPDLTTYVTAASATAFTNKTGAISQWTNDSGYSTTTGTVTPSSTDTFTNKSGAISQWTNDSGYSTTTGTVTPSSTDTFTNKSGAISQWTNDSGYITSAPATDLTYTDATRVIASSTGTDATLPRAGTSTDGLMRARLNGTTAYLTYDGTVA